MNRRLLIGGASVALAVGALAATTATGQMQFGTEEDVAYAASLWQALDDVSLVGDRVIHGVFYEGVEQHGFVLETFYTPLTVEGETALAIVKRNYGPEGVAIEEVSNNPDDHLSMITVMFQREGFSPDTGDWFWVAYMPDGIVAPAGEMVMAGNVGGCIGCHSAAPGDDWVYTTVPAMALE